MLLIMFQSSLNLCNIPISFILYYIWN